MNMRISVLKRGPLLHIVKPRGAVHNASVIFLHCSGEIGRGILDWVKFLNTSFEFPHIKFIFLTVTTEPSHLVGGKVCWFRGIFLSPDVPEHDENINTVKDDVIKIVDEEIKKGIPLNRIIIGGFSLGGILSLHMAYRFLPGLAGVFALSSVLVQESEVYKNIKSVETPLFMCHGESDRLFPLKWGKDTFDHLCELGVKGEFIQLPNTFHELKMNEFSSLFSWIEKLLPEEYEVQK